MTWVKERVFIFDPGSVSVLLWTIFSNEILDIRPYNNDLYIWGSDGKFHNYQLLSVEQGISMLLANSFWELSAKLCCFYESVVISAHSRNSLPKKSLENLLFHLQERNDCALNGEIRDLICRLNEPEKEPYANQNGDCNEVVYPVESGIYVVNRPSDNPLENPPPRMCSNGSVFQSKPFMNGNIKRQVTTNNDSAVETKDIRASLKNAQLTLLPTTKSQDACTTSSLSRISKTSSAVDLKSIKEKPNSNYKISFDDMLYEYDTPLPLLMSVAGGVFWDNDPVDVFPSMALLNPSAAFDELKNRYDFTMLFDENEPANLYTYRFSLSSKYQSGKEHILCKIGLLEDRIKSRAVDDSTELLDVKQSAVTSSNHKSAEDSVSSNLKYSPVVKINLLPLYDVTKVTWEVINNPALKDKLLEVLENWVNCLIATQELTYCELHTQQVKMRNSPNVNTHTSDISKSMFCSTLARSVSTASSTELNHDGKCAQDSKEQTSCTLTNGYRRQSCPNLINVEDNSCYTIHEKNHLSNCIMNEHSTYVQFEDILWWQEVELLNDNCLLRVKKENGYPCVLCYPIAFITDHWGSDAFLHKLMRNIALMCFQTKTFGRITDFCKYFACFSRIENLQTDVLSSDAQCSSESETEKMNFILDHARSVFVRQFFHLFEPKNILQELHNDTTITFKTWKAILMGVLQLEEFDSELRQSYHDLSIFSSLTDALRYLKYNSSTILRESV